MDSTESTKIAQAWIEFQRNWWAYDKLDDLCRQDPDAAWLVIVDMLEIVESVELLEDIAVGPLEDFIAAYALEYFDAIEALSKSNETFAKALTFVSLRAGDVELNQKLVSLGCAQAAVQHPPGD